MEFIYIFLFIVISGLIMIMTNILYDLSSAIIPIITIIMIGIGIMVGFVVALKNTIGVYIQIFFKKGK
jgi:hypothetical protein